MIYEFGEVSFDPDARALTRGGELVHLSPKAVDLLEFLIARRPNAVPKQDLYDLLWPSTFVVEANLPILIGEIRAAIGDVDHTGIRTLHRFGYAFAAEAREHTGETGVFPKGQPIHLLQYEGRDYFLTPGYSVIGREPSSTISIPSSAVSRRHAAIKITGNEATIVDLGSKNGTLVNGQAAQQPLPLHDGCAITIGGKKLTYRLAGPELKTVSLSDRVR